MCNSHDLSRFGIYEKDRVFLGSDRGGKTMAVLRSFVASCELAKIDPFEWFRDVLSRIPTISIRQLDALLPHAWAAARP
jgi:hypothetical protein